MKLSIFRVLHKTAALRRVAKRIPPHWCFLADGLGIDLAVRFYPHARRNVQSLAALLSKRLGPIAARRKARDYLLYRRWQNHLEVGWENWARRIDDFVRMEGTGYLDETLARGSGAVLLSGHYYGLDRLVDPILAQKGYAISRWANPVDSQSVEDRWGKGDFKRWKLLDFHGDSWHHTQMILQARRQLKENRLVHLSLRGQRNGKSEFRVESDYGRFFLEAKGVALLELLGAPVLPCFAMPGARGTVVIKFYPPLEPVPDRILQSFGGLYSGYLNEHPEYSRIWRRLVRGDAWW